MKYLFSLLFIGMTLVSFAQNNMGQMKGMRDFTPEQNAVLQTKKMTLALDLNSSQQKQILEINKKRSIERNQKMETRRAMMSGDKRLTSDERFEIMNKMLDYQLVYQSQMKSILKSDQYTQWKTMQKNQMTKMHKKGKMMKGKSSHHRNGYGNGHGQGKKMKNN